jgi:hypothetical protein
MFQNEVAYPAVISVEYPSVRVFFNQAGNLGTELVRR